MAPQMPPPSPDSLGGKPATGCFTFHAVPAEPMEIDPKPSNAIGADCTRSSSGRIKTSDRAALRRKPPAMLFWALLASGQITMRKGRRMADPRRENQTIRSLNLAA